MQQTYTVKNMTDFFKGGTIRLRRRHGKNKSLPSLEHVKSIGDAVNFAMGFEKETLLYFYEIRNIIKEKDIVDEIINEEKSHIMWLSRFKGSFTGGLA